MTAAANPVARVTRLHAAGLAIITRRDRRSARIPAIGEPNAYV